MLPCNAMADGAVGGCWDEAGNPPDDAAVIPNVNCPFADDSDLNFDIVEIV